MMARSAPVRRCVLCLVSKGLSLHRPLKPIQVVAAAVVAGRSVLGLEVERIAIQIVGERVMCASEHTMERIQQ